VRLGQTAPISLEAEFDCAPDELLALVGPSGGGKTTILRMIAGLRSPPSGCIVCNGQIWLDQASGIRLAPQRRSVGMMFQHYALFPHLSALHNVTAGLGHLPPSAREARARALFELVHLAGLEARHPHELSGGQQQRVALARALARDPQVLLLDEPFSAVDQVTRRKLRAELVQLRRRIRLPIVLVTHDLDEARMLADRMCILDHGRVLQSGPPEEVMARPASPTVARLVDHTNIFEGTVLEHREDAGISLLRWRDHTLEVAHRPEFAPGSKVAWVIPPENVILHRRDRPSRGERENPVAGKISDYIPLGETTTLAVAIDGGEEASIVLSVPTHVARRNDIQPGVEIRVSLLASGIHLMPTD
jgi:molybdate transport system ATP-binding protein